jgi:predicted transcriptional regulator of viral defense system
MGIGYTSVMPYSIKKQIPPTVYTSTTADSTTFTGTLYGKNYIVAIQCTTGGIRYNATGVTCTTANGNLIMEGDTHTFLVCPNSVNPNSNVSLFGLSTTTQFQAWIFD